MAGPRGTIVVTGAAGFIGRACMTQLAARGFRVRGLVRTLDRTTAARPQFLPVGDLAQVEERALAHALRDATAVVHLAARVHRMQDNEHDSQAAYRRMNAEVSAMLARAAVVAGATHFVLASTVKVNGESTPVQPFRESDPPDPHDDYAHSKWAAEQAVAAIAEDTSLRATALRLPLTYGRGAKGNFAALVRAVRRGVPLPLPNVANRRSVLGVDNLCAALAALLASDNGVDRGRIVPYFVADTEPVSTIGLARAIADALRVAPRIVAVRPGLLRVAGACFGRAGAVERLIASLEVDTSAFAARFGWTPPFTLAQGLSAAVANSAPL
jgi:UDP-glucose 4-epimerase